jgi:UPF0716 protein FxsA
LNAFSIFALLFLAIPIVEIYLLIQVGSIIGVFPTILMVIATAVIGAFLLRQQGLSTLTRFQNNVAQGQVPAMEMLEGIILLVGGALLMTPGFFTDTIGFLCLLPFSRRIMVHFLVKHSMVKVTNAASAYSTRTQEGKSPDGSVYEGEFTKKDDDRIEHK